MITENIQLNIDKVSTPNPNDVQRYINRGYVHMDTVEREWYQAGEWQQRTFYVLEKIVEVEIQ
jgi:hypothetical protein